MYINHVRDMHPLQKLIRIFWKFPEFSGTNEFSISSLLDWKFLSLFGMLNRTVFFVNMWHSVPKDDNKFQSKNDRKFQIMSENLHWNFLTLFGNVRK